MNRALNPYEVDKDGNFEAIETVWSDYDGD